ncbi:MAG: hypothetical protein V8R75_14635 [Oscillospiraceae bacterium]
MIATSFCPHRISIITGHYGTGKTEFAVNLAMAMAAEGQPVMMADLDIVNPYFRSRERRTMLEQAGSAAHFFFTGLFRCGCSLFAGRTAGYF